MKTPMIALALFALTGSAIALYPERNAPPGPAAGLPVHQPPSHDPVPIQESPGVEVVFVLDTTGSMGGLIQTAKEKIWSIATTIASAQPAPQIRMGLVAYRDRGDAYVTRVTDLSDDLDSVYATLMDYRAEGGGDGPESVNAALAAAVSDISWSQDPDTYRVVFLVGDAPPHMDYQDDVPYPDTLAQARQRGIVVNTIRCGENAETARAWRHMATLAGGDYFTVSQSGGGVAIATPYDAELASLSAALDATRLSYGDAAAQGRAAAKTAATDRLHAEASAATLARRAAFNALASGERNLFGENDLLAAVQSGHVALEAVAEQDLPEALQPLAPEARQAYLAQRAEEREALGASIRALTAKRDAYLTTEAAARGDLSESLDYQIFEAVRDQAAAKGLAYEASAPKL